jgi:hypothetical protein
MLLLLYEVVVALLPVNSILHIGLRQAEQVGSGFSFDWRMEASCIATVGNGFGPSPAR